MSIEKGDLTRAVDSVKEMQLGHSYLEGRDLKNKYPRFIFPLPSRSFLKTSHWLNPSEAIWQRSSLIVNNSQPPGAQSKVEKGRE